MEELYFIAIVPASPLRDKALALKEYFRDNYQSKASLNSPPHITLHMPFRFKAKKLPALIDVLKDIGERYKPFLLKIKNFGAFPPRVIFLDVEENEELQKLQYDLKMACRKQLKLMNANYKDHAFHPHLTLAFRDLRKPQFTKAWEEFRDKPFEAAFEVSEVCLLRHNGKKWEMYRSFKLYGASS